MLKSHELNEKVLPDDYPVNWDYLYVADGVVIRSDIHGTVKELKHNLISQKISANVITTCNISGRINNAKNTATD